MTICPEVRVTMDVSCLSPRVCLGKQCQNRSGLFPPLTVYPLVYPTNLLLTYCVCDRCVFSGMSVSKIMQVVKTRMSCVDVIVLVIDKTHRFAGTHDHISN